MVWHRRAGKDSTALAIIVQKMFERVGNYYHLFPTYRQAKKAMWDGVDRDGVPFMNRFPKELIQSKNESEMRIVLKNGSAYQLVGTDRALDFIVGTNPVGLVFSEYSIMSPKAWDLLRPAVNENGGWALFIYTPRGENHGYDLYTKTIDNPKWFNQLLTINDTSRGDGTPVITQEAIEEERSEGMDDALIDQEYFCSFQAAVPGAYFGKEMKRAMEDGRIGNVPWEPSIEVETYFDLGIGDSTAIWFCQQVPSTNEVRVIDYYENSGEALSHYVNFLKSKPYVYGRHVAPHDIEVRELTSGVSRRATAQQLGINFDVLSNTPKDEQIDAGRRLINRCWFDEQKCRDGLSALRNYTKEFDDKHGTFKMRPVHNWASHGADAFLYMAIGIRKPFNADLPQYADSNYSVFDYK